MSVMEVNNLSNIDGNVLVDFYTKTCAPCRAMNPVLEEIASTYSDITVAKVDVSMNPSMSQRFQIMAVPTLMVLKNSKVKAVRKGLSSKDQIMDMLEKHLGVTSHEKVTAAV